MDESLFPGVNSFNKLPIKKEENENIVADFSKAKDFDLAQESARGNMEAFEEIYKRHHKRVYSICLRMLQNTAEAEDLTQNAFIKLHSKIGSFRGDSEFTTWLHRLTVNEVLMHFRKRSVKTEKIGLDEIPEGLTHLIVSGTGNPNQMRVVDAIALDEAIEEMRKTAPGYANVFKLHDIEGYEHEEVAKLLGCSVGTSKSQLHKARLSLKKLLNKKAKLTLEKLHDYKTSSTNELQ